MAIERKSVVDQLEFPRAGGVQVRFALLIVDGDEEISSSWHRTYIPEGMDPALQIAAVNEHLAQMGAAQIDAADIARVAAFCAFGAANPVVHQRAAAGQDVNIAVPSPDKA
jgi:hypothetical protein